MRGTARMPSDLAWKGMFDGRFEDRHYAIEVFKRCNVEVKERVPAEKLLVYEVNEGWEALCEFLGVEAPENKPFPHLNDAEAFHRMIRPRLALAFSALIGGVSLVAIALLYLVTWHRTSGRA
jgi:Sulfotransferase domain